MTSEEPKVEARSPARTQSIPGLASEDDAAVLGSLC